METDSESIIPAWILFGEKQANSKSQYWSIRVIRQPSSSRSIQANERLEELLSHPDWHVYGDGQPTFQQLLDEFESVIAKHSNTIFIGAHAGNCAENLDYVAKLLDKYPNYYIEPSARIAELGKKTLLNQRTSSLGIKTAFCSAQMLI